VTTIRESWGVAYTTAIAQRSTSREAGRVVKVVILAGGFGTRLSEETASKPKPMVEIGERPILWHIMKAYSHYGFSDFVVCLGYKGYVIKEYFSNYFLHMSDVGCMCVMVPSAVVARHRRHRSGRTNESSHHPRGTPRGGSSALPSSLSAIRP
jgi:hypothetical protein